MPYLGLLRMLEDLHHASKDTCGLFLFIIIICFGFFLRQVQKKFSHFMLYTVQDYAILIFLIYLFFFLSVLPSAVKQREHEL